MNGLGGWVRERTWVTREEIAEIHEARAFQVGIWNVASVREMARLLKQAQDIRDVQALENEQGRRIIARRMDDSPPLTPGPQLAPSDPDFDWGFMWPR